MIEALKQFDTILFRWINGHHNVVLDWVLWTFSQHWFWLVVLLLAFAFITLRHEPRRWWIVLVGVICCFVLADQGSVHLFKDTFCRLRPCHALDEVRMFRTNCGGQYGFISSHAANAFAIVAFLWMRYRKVCSLGITLMVLWAVLTCYSRAYLGKHYPADLACGALFGIAIGLLVGFAVSFFEKKYKKCETK